MASKVQFSGVFGVIVDVGVASTLARWERWDSCGSDDCLLIRGVPGAWEAWDRVVVFVGAELRVASESTWW